MDRNTKLLAALGALALLFFGYKVFFQRTYKPIYLEGRKYVHVDLHEVNGVENHFFTVGGGAVPSSDSFVQISRFGGLSATNRVAVQAQVISSFGLQPVGTHADRFFSLFEGALPVYAHMRDDACVLYVGPELSDPDPEALLASAGSFIGEWLVLISSDF